MGFALTLLFITISLLSPAVLPEPLQQIHILQIIAALVVLASLPNVVASGVLKLRITYYVTGLLAAASISIIASGWLGGALDFFLNFAPIIAMYYFVVMNFTTLNRLKVLALTLAVVLSFIVVQGMLAVHAGDFTSHYLISETVASGEIYRFRGLGVINDPNDLAQVIVTTIPLLWLRWKKGSPANVPFTLLPAAFLCAGVYLTHSRGGLMALVAATLYGFKDRLGFVRSVILTSILGLALLFFNASGGRGMNEDDGGRVSLWGEALGVFRTHPLFGVGAGNFTNFSDNGLTAHNSYVLCLAELGLLGSFFWTGTIVTAFAGLGALPEKTASSEQSTGAEGGAPPRAGLPLRPAHAVPPAPALRLRQRAVAEAATGSEEDAAPLRNASHVVRSALVGSMVSAFFISRTYAMIFYIAFGIAGTLQVMRWRVTGDGQLADWRLKPIGITLACGIVFLYLFIRLRGAH